MVSLFHKWNNNYILIHLGGHNAVFYREQEDAIYYNSHSSIREDAIIGIIFSPMFIIGVFLHITLVNEVNKSQLNMMVCLAIIVLYYSAFWAFDMVVRNAVFSKVKRCYKRKMLKQVDKAELSRLEISIINEKYGVSLFTVGLCFSLFLLAAIELCLLPLYPGEWKGMLIVVVFFLECAAYLAVSMKIGKRKRVLARIRQILTDKGT